MSGVTRAFSCVIKLHGSLNLIWEFFSLKRSLGNFSTLHQENTVFPKAGGRKQTDLCKCVKINFFSQFLYFILIITFFVNMKLSLSATSSLLSHRNTKLLSWFVSNF